MASYKEIIALSRDPVRVRAVARRLLASAEDWAEWERDFLEGLVGEYGSEALSAPQREKLAELRRGVEYALYHPRSPDLDAVANIFRSARQHRVLRS